MVARFGQNLGHAMTSVVRACRRADICFGDFKAAKPTANFPRVPDITILDGQGNLLVVGEVKRPWKHEL